MGKLDKAFIAEQKKALEEQKAKVEDQLKAFARRDEKAVANYNTEFPDYGDKEDENASEVATFTDNLSVEHTLGRTLSDIDAALQRIVKGTYGKCKYCGQEIDERRLKARPESGSCIKCKTGFLHKG